MYVHTYTINKKFGRTSVSLSFLHLYVTIRVNYVMINEDQGRRDLLRGRFKNFAGPVQKFCGT